MTRVDFYVLQNKDLLEDRYHFACRLVEKAVKQGNRVLISTANQEESHKMDALLWSYAPDSFVPHELKSAQNQPASPVLISHSEDDESHHDVMVNLSLGLPEFFSRFKRVTEIVVQEETVLKATRDNYSWYKDRGYPLNTHKM